METIIRVTTRVSLISYSVIYCYNNDSNISQDQELEPK